MKFNVHIDGSCALWARGLRHLRRTREAACKPKKPSLPMREEASVPREASLAA